MTITLLHGSDVHFGKPHLPDAAERFLKVAHDLAPDAIVLSGDFTQRAKAREFAQARHWLDQLPDVPVVVTPGNHDVPLYRFWERTLAPFHNYRRFLGPELDTVTRVAGATVVALNSAAPHTAIVNGRITEKRLRLARRAFSTAPAGDARIAVTHHNLVPAPESPSGPVIHGSRELLRELHEMGVELVLGGHLHRGFLAAHPASAEEASQMLIVMSGTTTSNRGRGAEKGLQSYNVVRLDEEAIHVQRFLSVEDDGAFVAMDGLVHPRRASLEGASTLEAPVDAVEPGRPR